MILANILAGYATTAMTGDVCLMHQLDFVQMCEEIHAVPVSGCVSFPFGDRPMVIKPARSVSERGNSMFASTATAERFDGS